MITINRKTTIIKASEYSKLFAREQIHEPANTWQEISDENKALFLTVAKELTPIKCYAFGSRAYGNYIPASDIDVSVEHLSPEMIELKVKELSQIIGVKVDIKLNYSTKILIPTQWKKQQSTTKNEAL